MEKSDGPPAMSVVYGLLEKSLTIDGWKHFATNAESFKAYVQHPENVWQQTLL